MEKINTYYDKYLVKILRRNTPYKSIIYLSLNSYRNMQLYLDVDNLSS